MITHKVSQGYPSGSTSLPAPLFSTQLWQTAWKGTDLHNSSSEADRYYNQQIMITSILQTGKQWLHESSPSDRMNQTLNDSEKLEVPGIETAGIHHTEAAVSALSK